MKTRWGTCVLIALLFAATLLAAQGAGVRNVSGERQGMVGRQHLVVKIERAADESFTKPAAHDLANSRLIIVKQGTHGTDSQCTDRLIADFVKQGSAAGLDASCTDQIHLPAFQTQAQ
jgi:hypothetical protein